MNTPLFPKPLAISLVAFSFAAAGLSAQTTVLHFSTSDTDADLVATNVIPGVLPSPEGTASAMITLSEDIPTEGVPAGVGNRSMNFSGTQVITIPGTQQLSHEAIIEAGGFTYETWFKWNGGSTLNAMIDYAGTEKFRITTETGILDFNFDAGSGAQELAIPTIDQWHYVALAFEHDGEPVDADLKIHGTMTWYFDSNEPAGSEAATKGDFGDSLNRTIGVGGHPLGFGADFFAGLLFEPRVTLGALEGAQLLYGGPAQDLQITALNYDANPEAPGVTLTWNSVPGVSYRVEFSTDLTEEGWDTALDTTGAEGVESTTILHNFLPGFSDLVAENQLFYRVIVAPDEA
ncbi:LamG-like jellyroll fold domain-containing protein [Verrucomicrobiaceae bacterium 227]